MDYGLVFVVFIAAMALAHLGVRTWRRVSRRLQADRPAGTAEASPAAPVRYSNWYCFFRPRTFSRGGRSTSVASSRKKSRPRPRAAL